MSTNKITKDQESIDKTDNELRLKMVEFSEHPDIQAQIGEAFYIWKNDPELISDDLTEDKIDDITFEKFFDWFLYDFRLFDTKERVIERFKRIESENLSVDEVSLLESWTQNVYSYFEVIDLKDPSTIRIKDIFTGHKLSVVDKAASKQIKTKDILGARPLKTGRNTYLSGIICVYPSSFKPLIIEFVNKDIKEYKKSVDKSSGIDNYLKDWGYMIGQFIEKTVSKPAYLTPEGDEFIVATAVYELSDPSSALNKISKIKSLVEITGNTQDLLVFSWEKKGRNQITGTLEIEDKRLSITCHTLEMLEKAKNKLEKELKGLLTHIEDKIRKPDNKTHTDIDDDSITNTEIEETPSSKHVTDDLDDYYERWLDTPHPVLNGLTPREAALAKSSRTKLLGLIEELELLYEHAKNRGEPHYDMTNLKKTLGL